MYGNDNEYANSRLEGTVVRHEDKPVYVHQVRRGMNVTVSYLDNLDENFHVKIDDLNLKPVPLGYCNKGNTAAYLMRKPMRRDWRQGVRIASMTSIGAFSPEALNYKELGQVIEGKYPSYSECLKKVAGNPRKMFAWCREWALTGEHRVFHKGDIVGIIVDGKPVLSEEFAYLKECLEEVL